MNNQSHFNNSNCQVLPAGNLDIIINTDVCSCYYFKNLDVYNDDTIHDMNVDFDRYDKTSEPDYFEDDDLAEYINTLNDWD